MHVNDLGRELRTMYDQAPYRRTKLMIHLFGIKYAPQIEALGPGGREKVAVAARLSPTQAAVIGEGMHLAEHVCLK